uniref:DUF4371 domain-containing protein n=1 Tax=Latimeria chalumnae TaxID=7897 RepID=H3A8E6_LATCH
NGERIQRSWLQSINPNNSTYCFCCKLFSSKNQKLTSEGLCDWINISALLKSHESSPEHIKHMQCWKELEMHLKKGKMIDQSEMCLIEAKRKYWCDVLMCPISIVQSLAERNLAFCGSSGSETLYMPSNGNFLKEVELLAKFDPEMEQHVGHVQRVDGKPEIKGHFLGFLVMHETTGLSLKALKSSIFHLMTAEKCFLSVFACPHPSLPSFPSVGVQVYTLYSSTGNSLNFKYRILFWQEDQFSDHCVFSATVFSTSGLALIVSKRLFEKIAMSKHMQGKRQGVQAQLLQKKILELLMNLTLNLVIADAAKSSHDAAGFFGYLQKLYNFFSTQRWAVLCHHVCFNVKLKPWSETRWESRELKAQKQLLKSQEVRERCTDIMAKVEAQALVEEIRSHHFLIGSAVWYDILININHVSKLLRSSSRQTDLATNLLESTKTFLMDNRNGFAGAPITTKEICEQMSIPAHLKQKSPDKPFQDALKQLEANFFNRVGDSAITSIEDRFQTMGSVKDKVGILWDLKQAAEMPKELLSEHCNNLQNNLSSKHESDLNGKGLFQENLSICSLLPKKMTAFEVLSFIHKNQTKDIYPNLWIALRI